MQNEDDVEQIPVTYSIDNMILMHRDAHFGGNFDMMIDYYKKNGKGVSKEFDLERIQELADYEKKAGKNIAAVLLSGTEMEKIASVRKKYQQLSKLYESKDKKKGIPTLIADLILAEEEETQTAIQAIVAEKSAIVPALIDLLRNEDFYDPLFPGYGIAPILAAKCLGMIGDKRAIISLFEAIGEGDFFNEDIILDALHVIGEPAKEFLLTVLHGRPLTMDNEKAAIALITFKEDPEVSTACLKALKEIDPKKNSALATYLALACEGLKTATQRREFLDIAKNPSTPKPLKLDIQTVAESW